MNPSWRAMAGLFGGVCIVLGLSRMVSVAKSLKGTSNGKVVVLLALTVLVSVGYGGWLMAELWQLSTLRANIAALLLGVGGVFVALSSRLVKEFMAQLDDERSSVERKLLERTAELSAALGRVQDNHEQLRTLLEVAEAVPFEFDLRERRLTSADPQADLRLLGVVLGQVPLDEYLRRFVPEQDQAGLLGALAALVAQPEGTARRHEYRLRRASGELRPVRVVATVVRKEGAPAMLRGFTFDVSAMRRLEEDLHQAQKLEAVGRLAAGVAHEINTPVQFITDSLTYARESVPQVFECLDVLARRLEGLGHAAVVAQTLEAADVAFSRVELPKAVDRALDGASRIGTIVRAMKDFARPDADEARDADLNQALRNVVEVSAAEVKPVADVRLDLGTVSTVQCHVGELRQALLNLVVNAAHAIGERQSSTRGLITVRSRQIAEGVLLEVEDTGVGIAPSDADRVFEPFFTTREVGRGTGQGLTIARRIVVERHGGRLWFDSRPGEGTVFHVLIPRLAAVPAAISS